MELDGRHLGEAIERAVGEIGKIEGLTALYAGTQHGKLLDDEAQRVVFFVVEEALRNIEQHAMAHQVDVRMWQENNWFAVQVKDDGAGFDVDSAWANDSPGMITMRERVARLDGTFRVVSRLDQGTTVTVLIPLDKHGRRKEPV
jgi:signal transduction histidine kinase